MADYGLSAPRACVDFATPVAGILWDDHSCCYLLSLIDAGIGIQGDEHSIDL